MKPRPAWMIGDIVVHRVDEVALPPPTGSSLLPAATPDAVAQARRLPPDFAATTASCASPTILSHFRWGT